MQDYLADLHIHSRFSRATSRRLDVPLLAAWARLKGLSVIGSGDFTHPAWREELARHLRFDEASGLYALADPRALAAALPELPVEGLGKAAAREGKALEDAAGLPVPEPRFLLQGEISSIYKRGGKVRKVHNLVFMPTLEAAEAFSLRLEQLGNLKSDGRPILGLDSRDLLEMVLEAHPLAFLVPAHIWTPWFSVFGSKSGFDRLEDCFADLSGEIFALETGLSSDPAMNRLWSALDGYRLISNSDAHSGENLGREANVFAGEISYQGMLEALKHPGKNKETLFRGTLEFFPEEGKYHRDGHRKCGVALDPEETRKLGGLCPVCGGPLTVGVFSRVAELADRSEPVYQTGDGAMAGGKGFFSLVPLPEILGEIFSCGSKSRRVGDMYAKTLERFGPELTILLHTPEQDLARFFPPLGEAVARMRGGRVRLSGGYDGEYGVVRMFSDEEQRELARGLGLSARKGGASAGGLTLPGAPVAPAAARGRKKSAARQAPAVDEDGEEDFAFSSLDDPATPLPPDPGAFSADAASPDMDSPGFGSSGFDSPGAPLSRQTASSLKSPTARAVASDAVQAEDAPLPGKAGSPAAPASAPLPSSEPLPSSGPLPGQEKSEAPAGLNPEQESAVLAGPGPVLTLAGPGTGKTRTLIARILHLLDEGIGSRRIVALTFTRRAASEIDARLSEAMGKGAPLPKTDTLHALALELWHKTHADVPVLLAEDRAKSVFADANPDVPPARLREAWQAINLARERLEPPLPEHEEIARRYAAQKSAWNLADYTDLLEFWLEQCAAGLFSSPWGHVLVDEVQDLSPLQLTLVAALVSSPGEGFFGIGDPDQSIYGFRGAHGDSPAFFRKIWPGLEIISLRQNYRSRPGIVLSAQALLGDKRLSGALEARQSQEARLHLFSAPTAEAEAAWVADRAAELLGSGSHSLADAKAASPSPHGLEADHSPGDIAVLLRTNALAAVYRKALARKGVPVSEPAADVFWADERVALIIRSAGRMLGIAAPAGDGRPEDPVCPDKVFANGPLGVAAYLSAFPPFDESFSRSPAFRALVKAYDANEGWAGLLTWTSLQNELELVRAKGERVQVMSMHAAKGLEFKTVFLPALEDGLLPFAGTEILTGKMPEKSRAPEHDETAEERRLFYVALTRARDSLFLSYAGKRLLYGKELRLKPSRFLASLPEKPFSRSALVAKATRREEHLSLI